MLDRPPPGATDATRLNAFGIFLHQLATELDLLGQGPAPEALRKVLGEISLPTARNARGDVTTSIDAASFVARAIPILIDREANRDRLKMPLEWPRVSTELGGRIVRAALDCLSARHAQMSQAPGKFETLSDQYAVRGFIRVRRPGGCPDKLVWSAYSERFRILPWWDGDGPATRISLPDMSQLKKVKPSVAFDMPPQIANLLKGDMKALSDGEKQRGQRTGGRLAVQLLDPVHHDLRLHRPQYLPVPVRHHLPLDAVHQDLHPHSEEGLTSCPVPILAPRAAMSSGRRSAGRCCRCPTRTGD